MDASSRNLLGLISEINTRFVVPVYQRPYSWGDAQCLQLWNDIVDCGRSSEEYHFTGSIVTIQDGSVSDDGVTSLLLIDGQQRITTFMLILMSLARYQLRHPELQLAFSCSEIVMSGFLSNHFRKGADHYKLTLSKGDAATYQALVDSLEDHSLDMGLPCREQSQRIMHNLELFDHLIETIKDPESVWVGMRRLEVVSIALTQGRDRPQLIFESMNSTGKDLSTSDLVRNYVLMDYPITYQGEAYRMYWAPIESILGQVGQDSFDKTFDDFLRTYLTAVCAPQAFNKGDLYVAFKRYIQAQRYNQNNRMRNFVLKFKSFAEYYSQLCLEEPNGSEVSLALERLNALGISSVRPLVLVLMDMRDRHAISTTQLVGMLNTLEAYLIRRFACDCDRSGLPKFFSSLIARLDAVFDREGNYEEAFYALLRNEDGGEYAFPTNEEFVQALQTRDAYHWNVRTYVLARMEQDARNRAGQTCELAQLKGAIVEHIAPLRSAMSKARRGTSAVGSISDGLLNTLGNLALSWQSFDLQTDSFEEKRRRLQEGGTQQALISNADLFGASEWGSKQIRERGERLAQQAVALWPLPEANARAQQEYRPRHRKVTGQISFADLMDAGLVRTGDTLVSANPSYPGSATVEFDGSLLLSSGEHAKGPQEAYQLLLANLGVSQERCNGWLGWRRGEGGPLLDELREALQ